ncbi:hypothetical protein [Thalassospira alkalitolerans]|uniref:hypothetical protein n=1 Tax=Thalassospira alkalitolerans TaxID=1293890 RepID=UPI003AA99303
MVENIHGYHANAPIPLKSVTEHLKKHTLDYIIYHDKQPREQRGIMMPKWLITEYDGTKELGSYELPSNYTDVEIEHILQRLVCRKLTQHEIISASRRHNDKTRTALLDRTTSGKPLSFGENPHFTAIHQD